MNRRKFIRNTGIALGTLGVGSYGGVKVITSKIDAQTDSSVLGKNGTTWSNWSGGQTCTPKEFFMPNTEDELIAKLKSNADKMRMVGGGHSFSPVVPTGDVLTSLKNMKGIISHNDSDSSAVIRAGSHLYEVTEDMLKLNLSMANQGDINRQSLGGAIATATHGTGSDLTSFAGTVKGFRLITANGEAIDCTPESNADLFYGGLVSLGAMGVVTQYNMQLMPKYKLREHVYPTKVSDVLDNYEQLIKDNRHFEAWIFLHSDTCLAKTLNITDDEITPPIEVFPTDDQLLALGLTLSGQSAGRTKRVMGVMSGMLEETHRVGWAQHIFPSERNVRFNEMEYELPAENGVACMRELLSTCKKADMPMFFPFEIRNIKRDNFWMSPFYERDSISISAHQFHGYEYEKYFKVFHEIMKKYGGRTHWAKLCYFTKEEVQAMYPKYNDFVKFKNELDPKGRFSNAYIDKYFA